MLKGVNKQILEITNTESPYFEKIIFFVKTSSPDFDKAKLKAEAEKISASTSVKPPRSKHRVNKRQFILLAISSVMTFLSGMGLYFLVYNYIMG